MSDGTLFSELSAVAGPAPVRDLPRPARERFQPLRAGILNLWQYDDQELLFHDGRLLLRGENGSGKSKALELLLPFLLDADLSPHRLDPFASHARRMEWNLLEGDLYANRLGYVWLELGRLAPGEAGDAAQAEQYLTLGCGLRANRASRRVDAWYFLTSRRIGREVSLVGADRVPLGKEALRAALGGSVGDGGEIFDAGRDYRERLDALLYGLGAERYAALRELLLQLRRPHLSEKLDPAGLSGLLSDSLPPLDADLIQLISENYERLEHDQAELKRIEGAVRAVEGFLGVYAEYARGISRARAAEVRQADSRYHKTAGEARAAAEEAARVEAGVAELDARSAAADGEIAALQGNLRALEQSDAMRQAAALSAKKELATSLAAQAVREGADLSRDEAAEAARRGEREESEREAERSAGRRLRAASRADAAAGEVGLDAANAAARAALDEAAEAPEAPARATVEAAVRKRHGEVDEVVGLLRQRDAARSEHEAAERRRQDADAQARAAAERTAAARARAEGERESLAAALAAWAAALVEIVLAPEEALRLEAAETALAAEVESLARPRRDALIAARASLDRRAEGVAAERAETAALRAEVAGAREVGPERARTRPASREGRPGAPLYLLCDLAPGLDPAEAAGLEAALEAAGLLDAWISPQGRPLDRGTLDAALVPTPLPGGRTLADALVPVPGYGVESEAIAAILRSVALPGADPAEAAVRSHQVDPAGGWRLGPLRGTWAKPVAEHLGAGAREATRARRLAELDERLARLDALLAEIGREREEIGARLDRLSFEASRAPSAAPLAEARVRADAAEVEEARRLAELAEAEAAAAAARRRREEAERRLDRRAQELGLAAHVDSLDEFRRRLGRYRAAFEELLSAAEAARATGRAAEAAAARLAQAAERAAEARARAEAGALRSRAAEAEYEALERTVGVEAREVVERHRQAQEELSARSAAREGLRRERQRAGERRAALEVTLRQLSAEQEERDRERGRSVFRLQRLGAAGLLGLFFAELPEGPPAAWTLTRSLELARALEAAIGDVDRAEEAATRRLNRLHARHVELTRELGAELEPSLAPEEDNLWVASIRHDHRNWEVRALLDLLRGEAAKRRELLLEDERAILRRFVLGEVGDHLRKLLRQAEDLVGQTNRLLAGAATASGLTLRLSWRPGEESAEAVREAVRRLAMEPELLGDADRRALEAFFQGRIDAARQDAGAVPWREHLMQALDYRRWHEFRIQQREAGDKPWQDLTRRRHEASSGGEKAVALHLPLFAAAAAHYQSARPTAPRLILLDEAFAGIDEGMRGRIMALLVEFDLDFLITSHDEWGCYAELPGLSIYQLYRDPALRGILAVRFVWDGRRRAERPAG